MSKRSSKFRLMASAPPIICLLCSSAVSSADLQQWAQEKQAEWENNRAEVEAFASQHGIPVREELADGTVIEMQRIENGIPMYYTTNNADAAITTRTDKLWASPFSVTGSGYEKLGEWDGGAVSLLTIQPLIQHWHVKYFVQPE